MSEYKHIISYSPEETHTLGREFASELHKGDCVALSGELGSGKTQFVQGICEYFRCLEQVSSPTFTIINEYHGTEKIAHCDLYRLNTLDELFETGLMQLFENDFIVLIEWAEKALPVLPLPRWECFFEHISDEQKRKIWIDRIEASDKSIIQHIPEFVFQS